MDSALAWVGQIAAWFGSFIPRWTILATTEGAVKFVGGDKPVLCGPGIHFYWPARTIFHSYPTARQTDRLEAQVMETRDKVTLIASAMITYSVDDLMKLLPTTHNAQTAIADMAMAAVHDICADMDYDTLQAEHRRGTLKTKLRNEAQKQLTDYGVKVIKVQLNSLARCRVLRVSQTLATEDA